MSDDMQKQLAEANKKLGEAEAKLKEYTDKEKELKELTQTVDELGKKLKEAESKNKELTEQIYTYSVEKKKTEINAELDKAVADKKIYPAQKEVLFALMMNVDERKFKFGNGEKTAGEILKEFIGSNKVDIHTEEESERGESHKEDVERSELDRKAQKYSQEHKVSYTEALKAIS